MKKTCQILFLILCVLLFFSVSFAEDIDSISRHNSGHLLIAAERLNSPVSYPKDISQTLFESRRFQVETTEDQSAEKGIPVWLIVLIIGVILVVGTAVGFVIIRRKKSRMLPKQPEFGSAASPGKISAADFTRAGTKQTPDDPGNDGPFVLLEITACDDTSMLGKRFHTNKLPITLGRNPDNDVCISPNEVSVSRYHARIEDRDGSIVIRDTGSKYGTFVNNRNIQNEPVKLKNDDVIKLGASVRIRYLYLGADSFRDDIGETSIGFRLANATLMADTSRRKIIK